MIQAHPDQEFERLQRAVIEMPINNPDDKTERFPKELSRRLFPKSSDKVAQELLEDGIITHCKIKPSVFASRKSPQPGSHQYRSPSSPDAPASSGPSPLGFDQGEDEPEDSGPSLPIERERMPYSAQPGGRRAYDKSPMPRAVSPIDVPPINFRDGESREEWTRSPPDSVGRYKDPADEHITSVSNDREPYESPASPGRLPDDSYGKRHRNHDRETGRKDDRLHKNGREHRRDREKRRHHERPPRVSWANDEDYYRGTGSLGGRSGDPYNRDPIWTGRY